MNEINPNSLYRLPVDSASSQTDAARDQLIQKAVNDFNDKAKDSLLSGSTEEIKRNYTEALNSADEWIAHLESLSGTTYPDDVKELLKKEFNELIKPALDKAYQDQTGLTPPDDRLEPSASRLDPSANRLSESRVSATKVSIPYPVIFGNVLLRNGDLVPKKDYLKIQNAVETFKQAAIAYGDLAYPTSEDLQRLDEAYAKAYSILKPKKDVLDKIPDINNLYTAFAGQAPPNQRIV